VTSGINERPYLSIGEVLGLLLEEFPDVTISKIRFLESQGLIEPERTSSGYRKFFDADIERLRVILREQRENFLPLRVIRDRLETGEIDDSGAIAAPGPDGTPAGGTPGGTTGGTVSQLHRGIRNVRTGADAAADAGSRHPSFEGHDPIDDTDGVDLDDPTGSMHPDAASLVTTRHPAAQARAPLAAVRDEVTDPTPTGMLLRDDTPLEVFSRAELCEAATLADEQLVELESYGLLVPRGTGANATYTSGDLAVARAAAGFLARGIDARHLRGWRQSAERESGLFEQRILPLLRQRNPQARHDAVQMVAELADLGAELRQALIVSMLRHHLDA
jgi:DNA-binding transcriptional MerR regulator